MTYTTNPYCTAAQVYSALDLSTSAQTNDSAWITNDLIPEAQEAIDSYLGFSFQSDGTVQAPATRVYSGKGQHQLYMVDRCISFSQVLEAYYDIIQDSNGTFYSGTPTTRDITADCVLGPDNAMPGLYLKRLSEIEFYSGVQNYKVYGVFGRPSIPPAITRACIRTITAWYKMRDSNYSDFIIEGMVRQHFQRQLPDDVMQLLELYKPRMFRC